jgi:hypothetical protein
MNKKTYTYQEALEASIKFFKGDELAASVWINKYALKDSFGNIYDVLQKICIGDLQKSLQELRQSIQIL